MSAVLRVFVCVLLVACSGGSEVRDAQPTTDVDASVGSDAPADPGAVDASRSTIEVDRTQAVSGVEQITVTVTVRDSAGMPIVGMALQLTATGSSNVITQEPYTDSMGRASATWTSTVAETKSVSAVAGGVTLTGPVVTFSPGPASKLEFTEQPTDVIAGAPFSPAVRVEAQDAFGNPVTTQTGYVVLTLAANPGSTTLRGTTFVELQNGAATFSATRVEVAGMSYSLRARLASGGLPDAISGFFDVTWGAPASAYSTVVAAPHSLEANGVDTTTVTFHVANPYGVALAGLSVSLAVSGSNNTLAPTSGTTDSQGDFRATLSSSTAELKIATGTAGTLMLMGTVKFHPPSCMPMLPGGPTTAFDDWSTVLHVADFDGDGVLDAVVGKSQQIAMFLGRGNGTFDPPMHTAFNPTGQVNDLESGDFNGDGKLDLVFSVSNTSALTILFGAGNGQFPTTNSVPLQNYAGKLAVADFNLDGKLDVISAMPALQKVVVQLGAGNGTFTASGSIDLDVFDFAVIDVNKDGKPDVIVSGSFSLATALGVGNGTFQALDHESTSKHGKFFTGDFNNDAKVDVAIADSLGVLAPFLGDGAGGFTASAEVVYRDPGPQAFQAGGGGVRDLDGDGVVDIIVSAGGATSILKGTGTGAFTLHRRYYMRAALLAEMNGDAFADAVGISGFAIEVVAGTSSTSFVAPTEIYRSTEWSPRLYETVADFDGNGRLDYVRYRSAPSAMSVMLTQQDGSVADASSAAATNSPYDAAAGDFTGDGKPDVAIVEGAVNGVTLELAVGNGAGALGAFTTQAVASPYVTNLVGADLNLDGKQDLVLYRWFEPGMATALSTGSAFGPIQSYSSVDVNSIVVRDISEDGIPDVVVAGGTGFSAVIQVFLGTGTGGLMMPVSYGTYGLSGIIAVGDLTNDGMLDLMFLARDPQTAQKSVIVFPGLAGASFGAPLITPNIRLPKLHMYERKAQIFDITGDGNHDLVVHSNHGTTVIGGYGDGYVRQSPFHYAVGHQGGAAAGATMDPVVLVDHDANTKPDFVYWNSGLYVAPNAGCVP